MINPKVSVIIPVYGAEAFLPDCIASLRAQTLRDIELIFICDGSPIIRWRFCARRRRWTAASA